LIVDANVLIKGVRIERLASEFWTVMEVLSEIRDKKTRVNVAALPFALKTREPSTTAVKTVVDFAHKIGEYASLSKTDLKVLALNYMIDSEVNGTSHFNLIPKPVLEVTNDNNSGEKSEDAEDEWITPENIKEVKAKHAQEFSSQEPVSVGCITADFAMQNVLLQMGMKLVSFDGIVIKTVRQYILRCFSCNKFCNQTEKKFCPACGNSTMVKVAKTVSMDGTTAYFQTQKVPVRGAVYSVPLPKGGRKNDELVFTEDRFYEKNRTKHRETVEGWAEGFAFASVLAVPKNIAKVGYGNKNPNIARRKIGKKNRTISTL